MKKRKFIIGGIVIIACVAGLVLTTTGMSLDFYDSVSQFTARLDSIEGRAVRVRGMVSPGEIAHDANTLDTEFTLADDDASVRVFYHGVLPSSFTSGSDLIVQGTYDADARRLVANQLMFKCPSKYESARNQR